MSSNLKTMTGILIMLICLISEVSKAEVSDFGTDDYCERDITNTISCNTSESYVMYLKGPIVGGLYFKNKSLKWYEYANGEVKLKGTVSNYRVGTAYIDIVLSGKNHINNPKRHNCRNATSGNFTYYSSWEGWIRIGHVEYYIKKRGEDFQVGEDANINSKEGGFGGSGWFSITNSSIFKTGDINVLLSKNCGNIPPEEECYSRELVKWNMEGCNPEGHAGYEDCNSNKPKIISKGDCSSITATAPCNGAKDFSCRDGKKGEAVCFDLDKGSVEFEVTMEPTHGNKGQLSSLSLYTASGDKSGYYRLRIYKRGEKIFDKYDNYIRKGVYQFDHFDFTKIDDFKVINETTYTFRFSGNRILEMDEISLIGGCCGDVPPCDIVADAGPDKDICRGDVAFIGSDGIFPNADYKWSTGSTLPIIGVSPTSTTIYKLTITKGNCSDTDEVKVNVNNIHADAGPDRIICKGEYAFIGSDAIIPDADYKWSTGSDRPMISVRPNTNTTYTLTVTRNGCSDIDNVNVIVEDCKKCDALTGETFTLKSEGGQTSSDYVTKYILVNQNGKISDIQNSPSFVVNIAGDYKIFAVNYSKSENIDLIIGGDLSSIDQECVDISDAIMCTICPNDNTQDDCKDFDYQEFEYGWGIWNDGGSDSFRKNNSTYAESGKYSIRLRDNTSGSDMYTDQLDFSDYESVEISFSYYSVSFDNSDENFILEVSKDGGSSFEMISSWVYGADFENDKRYYAKVSISKDFLSSSTIIRLRADASSNNDQVYIDNMLIKTCSTTINDDQPDDPDDDDPITDCNGSELNNESFETGLGIWNDGGSDCYRLNNSTVSHDGKYSIRLRDNSEGSKLFSDELNLRTMESIEVSFDYRTIGFKGGDENFILEVSTNGGSTFTMIKSWAHGLDFNNDQSKSVSIPISKTNLSGNTVIQLRCDASSNSDQVYIDNLRIKSCSGSAITDEDLVVTKPRSNDAESFDFNKDIIDFDILPNPAINSTRLDLEEVFGKKIKVDIFNSIGGYVKTISIDRVSERFLNLDLEEFTGGVYMIRMQLENDQFVLKKMTVSK